MATEETLTFIRERRNEDVRRLALGSRPAGVDMAYALEQIAGWQTARRKLPAWAAADGLIFPPRLSMEQCSSESAARYKQRLAERLLRDGSAYRSSGVCSLVDLTGGFGVDFSYMAQAFGRRTYVERQEKLCSAARNNMPLLGLADAEIVCGDAVEYLGHMSPADMVFIDPARRDDRGGRTYAISDCTPDVLSLRPMLAVKARIVMVKLSPMLDWHKAAADLGQVAEVHIVSVEGECKELLLVARMEQEQLSQPDVYCVECGDPAGRGAYVFSVKGGMQDRADEPFCAGILTPAAGMLLYEPGAAVMKAGVFDALRRKYGVGQLSANSHLFLSERPVEDFPGRSFQIRAVATMNKKELRQMLAGTKKANIAVRNFPLTALELRKRLRLGDGGEQYIFGTTLADGTHSVILCEKICK